MATSSPEPLPVPTDVKIGRSAGNAGSIEQSNDTNNVGNNYQNDLVFLDAGLMASTPGTTGRKLLGR